MKKNVIFGFMLSLVVMVNTYGAMLNPENRTDYTIAALKLLCEDPFNETFKTELDSAIDKSSQFAFYLMGSVHFTLCTTNLSGIVQQASDKIKNYVNTSDITIELREGEDVTYDKAIITITPKKQ